MPKEVASFLGLTPQQYAFEPYTTSSNVLNKFITDQLLAKVHKDREAVLPEDTTLEDVSYNVSADVHEDDDTNSGSNPLKDTNWDSSDEKDLEERPFQRVGNNDEALGDEEEEKGVSDELVKDQEKTVLDELVNENGENTDTVAESSSAESIISPDKNEQKIESSQPQLEAHEAPALTSDANDESPVTENIPNTQPQSSSGNQDIESNVIEEPVATKKIVKRVKGRPVTDKGKPAFKNSPLAADGQFSVSVSPSNRAAGNAAPKPTIIHINNARNVAPSGLAAALQAPPSTVAVRVVPQHLLNTPVPRARAPTPVHSLLRPFARATTTTTRVLQQPRVVPVVVTKPPGSVTPQRARLPLFPPVSPPTRITRVAVTRRNNGTIDVEPVGDQHLPLDAIKNILAKFPLSSLPVDSQQVLSLTQK